MADADVKAGAAGDALTLEQNKAEFARQWGPTVEHFAKKLSTNLNPAVRDIPFIGKQLYRYQIANQLEAFFFFLKSGDPVVDQKLINAFAIRNYEFSFAWQAGGIFSTAFFLLPAWKGFDIRLRLAVSAVPLVLSLYRGFRRGVDQVLYVGDTYVEHQLRKRALLQHLRDHDNYLVELKEYLLERGDFNQMLEIYGLRPLTQI